MKITLYFARSEELLPLLILSLWQMLRFETDGCLKEITQ